MKELFKKIVPTFLKLSMPLLIKKSENKSILAHIKRETFTGRLLVTLVGTEDVDV